MVVTHEFTYYQPSNLNDALKLLDTYGEKAALLAGGTDLAVYLKEDLVQPDRVIDVKKIMEFKTIDIKDKEIFIGARATFTDILNNEDIKNKSLLLWESARTLACTGIRNRATLVGNICSAVPCMNSAPALLCYDAVVHTVSLHGKRNIPVSQWFLEPRITDRKPDEIVSGVSFTLPGVKHSGCNVKLGRYRGEDLAQAGLGILMTQKKEYRLAFTAVGPVPARAKIIEKLLNGKALTTDLINKAKQMVSQEISPISDIRASSQYREHMCKVMLERGLLAAADRLNGKTIDSLRILGG